MKFICPRCGEKTSEVFYGPCDACRIVLREADYCNDGKGVMR